MVRHIFKKIERNKAYPDAGGLTWLK